MSKQEVFPFHFFAPARKENKKMKRIKKKMSKMLFIQDKWR